MKNISISNKVKILTGLLIITVFSVIAITIYLNQKNEKDALIMNIAGKQRMLTQKMGKIYLYLLKNPNDFKAKKDLKITKIIFEKQNLILEKNSSSTLTKNRLQEVVNTWERYKKFVDSSPNKDDAVKIINTNSTLLRYANNVVNAVILESKGGTSFEDTSMEQEDTELKEIINKSGKQRMLSQRIAKVFLVRKAGAHSPELSKEYNSSIQLFTRNLSILESNSKNSSSKIKASIKKEQMQWNLFKSKLQTPTSTVSEIISLSNNLLIKSNNLVLAIEEESKYNNEFNNNTSNDQLRVETINLSGKQRMLSQRLCLYYAACRLYKKEKIDASNACNEVEKIYSNMNESLNNLLINDLNSFDIEENIGRVLGMFNEIESNKKDFFNNKLSLNRIMTLTNNITSSYNIITGQYSSLK